MNWVTLANIRSAAFWLPTKMLASSVKRAYAWLRNLTQREHRVRRPGNRYPNLNLQRNETCFNSPHDSYFARVRTARLGWSSRWL